MNSAVHFNLEIMDLQGCKVAVMDLGSQTFRVVGAEVSGEEARVLFSLRRNVRIGALVAPKGIFSQKAMEEALKAIYDFRSILKKYDITKIKAIGTAAFRRASNSYQFVQKMKDLGIQMEIIDPDKETALAVKGAYLSIPAVSGPWIMLDSGGGSTEVALCEKDRVIEAKSLDIGAVSLLEACKHSGENLRQCLRDRAADAIEEGLCNLKGIFSGIGQAVATGGTATTIAAVSLGLLQYDPARVRGFDINGDALKDMYDKMVEMDVSKRKEIPGLESERADIFPAGIAILLELIRYLGLRKLIISDGGILLGLLAAFIEKECDFYVEPSSARGLYL